MTKSGGVAALILAAGYSSRMEAFKPLLPLSGSTVIEEVVRRFREGGVEDISVVTGFKSEEMAPVLRELGVRQVFNADFHKGMLTSVLAGLRSLDRGVEAFFLHPVDIPLIKSRTIDKLRKYYQNTGTKIIYPSFQGLRGHPPLIAKYLVAGLSGDFEGGMRAFLRMHDHLARDVHVIDESILMDCDTRDDYRALQVNALKEDIPTRRECEAIWQQFCVPEHVISHCCMVAELVRVLATRLKRLGFGVDAELVVAAGWLHDLAKGQKDHAVAGGRALEDMGYSRVGRVVASHMNIRLKEDSFDESDLLYLADKYVEEDRLVTIEERFRVSLERSAGKPEALRAIGKRLDAARTINRRIGDALGEPVEEFIRRSEKSIRMASTRPRFIYLVRHGAIEKQGDRRRYIGQMDIPLSREGIRQAETLRDRLRHVSFSAIYCSDLTRSIMTGEIIGEPHGLQPFVDKSFREISLGDWEGLSFDEVRERFPSEYQERGRDFVHFRPPAGESFMDCASRVIPAAYAILQSTRGNVLIAGHAGVNRILLCQAQNRSLDAVFDIPQEYGCLNLIQYDGSAFRVQVLNDTECR